ncbi:DUF4974 domain-containing protein [Lutibacter sp. A80]|uniref:FecR family protein n=1 Tax=Lutibacter sp. A80 TaxID=2918453 RepID=UPI001F06BE37|nr:FecR domain-containing protein [Lutibacter sp. A80]UMB62023.1 DUF4974 domain-containing protein [Lutibacter sp. A80]
MKKHNIQNIIQKFIENDISLLEEEYLIKWLENKKNQKIFEDYIKLDYLIHTNYNEFNKNKDSSKELLDRVQNRNVKPIGLNFNFWMKIAAILVVFLAVTYFFIDKSNEKNSAVVKTKIEIGTDKAILTLEDGAKIALEKGKSVTTTNAESNGEELVYKQAVSNAEIKYNTLTVPRGGQFFVELIDGTKVWLNSESQLKYPIAFIEGETRKVELLYGEAYFEVSPSTKNKGSKFMVLNNAQEIEVLGTKFNVKAYKKETNIYTTLIEGKVAVNTAAAKQLLKPNQQSKVQIGNNQLSVRTVDAAIEIAWIHGDFVFKHSKLKDIVTVLGRWYNVDIEIENKSLENLKFNGEFGKSQNLEDILILIKNTNYINQYEINEEKVILK